MLCRRVATGPTKLTIKPQLSSIFDTQTSFRAKKLPPDQAKPQTTSGFDTLTQTSFRAKGLPPDQPKSRKTLSFWHSNLVSCERVAAEDVKSQKHTSFWHSHIISCERVAALPTKVAKNPQFLTLEPRFVRKGCRRGCWIAKTHQFLTLEPHFVRKGCHIVVFVGNACGLKREKKKKERDGDRGQERERERWRWEDVKMRRCEDEKMYSKPPLLEEPFAQTLSGNKRISGRDSRETRPCPGNWCLAWIETTSCVQVLQTFWLLDNAGAVNVLLGLKQAAQEATKELYRSSGNYRISQRL